MKPLLLASLIVAGYTTAAQEPSYKIPKDATVVASIKGEKLLELMSVTEFNQTSVVKKMLEKIGREEGAAHYNSVEDFGIKVNGTVYYYNKQTDSISYHCVLVPLSDANKFEQEFDKGKTDKITRNGTTRTLRTDNNKSLLIWDNSLAYFITGNIKQSFLEDDSVVAARYGIKKVNYSDYYYDNAAVAVQVEDYTEETMVTDSVAYEEAVEAAPVAENELIDPPAEKPEIVTDIPLTNGDDSEVVVAPAEDYAYATIDNNEMHTAYDSAYKAQNKIKQELGLKWTERFAADAFRKNSIANSILENPAYLRSQDNDAVATFYLSNMQGIYDGLLPYYSKGYFGSLMKGYGSISAKLFLNNESARIATEMEVDDEKASSYKKMFRHKPNKKFAQYINSDKVVAFASYSFDTEEYLKELPQLISQSYGRYFGMRQEEMGIGSELFSLLLDEKAVAKVIKGDALILLSDIGPKEYTYTTYDYDADNDYKPSEVKKTKRETLPDFLFMMSSDDTRLIERVLNYGIKKEKVTLKNGIYSIDNKIARSNPFPLHILIKDGIVFCGTSYRDIQQISNGNFNGNINKEEKKLLLKNNFSMFFNPKNMVGKITDEDITNSRKLTELNNLLGSTGKIYARTTGIKDNIISGEMVAEVPEHKNNALKYFFSLMEQASKLD